VIGGDHRRLISGAALAAGVVAVVAMAVWGVNAATAPFGNGDDDSTAAGPGCPPEDQVIKEFVRRSEVTVSVYNAGKKKGHAGQTLAKLEGAGFGPGAVGDADAGDIVRRAEVRTTREDNAGARLVAKVLGPDVQVVVVDEDYGPGVDVFIGDRFKGLAKNAPQRERLSEPITTCR
jgi:hypothetical protein